MRYGAHRTLFKFHLMARMEKDNGWRRGNKRKSAAEEEAKAEVEGGEEMSITGSRKVVKVGEEGSETGGERRERVVKKLH